MKYNVTDFYMRQIELQFPWKIAKKILNLF